MYKYYIEIQNYNDSFKKFKINEIDKSLRRKKCKSSFLLLDNNCELLKNIGFIQLKQFFSLNIIQSTFMKNKRTLEVKFCKGSDNNSCRIFPIFPLFQTPD
jgi:hypothetical protein